MPYFKRTIEYLPKMEMIYFHQKTPECYGYCADWLESCIVNDSPLAWFNHNFYKPQQIKKFGNFVPYRGDMTPEAQARIKLLYQNYSSNPTGPSSWGKLLKGKGYQVEDRVDVPINDIFSKSLSKTISEYKYGMIGWNYDTGRDISHRNHQTAVMSTNDWVAFFDPNIGVYQIARTNFNKFFKEYYQDLIENEKSSLEQIFKSGFYDNIDIRGLSLILAI